ncbi:MAG: DNA repair protein RadA, partial [Lachnospiraceae bacterium]
FGLPRRTSTGTDVNRINLLMAVIEKRCALAMSRYDAYINIAGGLRINEPALDLSIIMSLVSSMKNKAIDEKTVIFGEVGLSGEVRAVSMPEIRIREAMKLGFEVCILPKVSLEKISFKGNIKLIGVKNINEAVSLLS